MKKFRKRIAAILPLCLLISGCGQAQLNEGQGAAPEGNLKIYVDGICFGDMEAVANAFQKEYPDVSVTIERLPQVKTRIETDGSIVNDTDSMAAREAALQQHRTALMAGSSDADLYLVTGDEVQNFAFNGGSLVQDPQDLMYNGVLSDLSGVTTAIDPQKYLKGIFEAGQVDGVQYIVPLRCNFDGLVFNQELTPDFPVVAEEFVQTLTDNYAQEMAELYQGIDMPYRAVSYPVVNKYEKEIALLDEMYSVAFEQTERLKNTIEPYMDPDADIEQINTWMSAVWRITEGRTILGLGAPFSVLGVMGQELLDNNMTAKVGFTACPNEKGGITAEISMYAFAPATCQNTGAAAAFLQWMLSEEVQSGASPMFEMLQNYPVHKGCVQKSVENSSMKESFTPFDKSLYDSMNALEERVTDAKFFSRYDAELTSALVAWKTGEESLDDVLAKLYDQWMLYLDE